MVEQLDFQNFLLSQQGKTVGHNYMDDANEGVTNIVRNFDVSKPYCAFEFAWNKSSLLVRSAVLSIAKRDYFHLFKQTPVDESAENFDDTQKTILQRVMKDVAADLVGTCSVMDWVAAYYSGLRELYNHNPDALMRNIGPTSDIEFIHLQNQAG